MQARVLSQNLTFRPDLYLADSDAAGTTDGY